MKRKASPILSAPEEFTYECSTDKKAIKLLIVDDQPSFCSLLTEQAELWEFQYEISCQFASTGEEAKRLMQSWHPSVVLLDLHAAEESLELIRNWTGGMSSVIATSTTCSKEMEETALAHGADAYVPKSENPDELHHLMERIVNLAPSLPEVH